MKLTIKNIKDGSFTGNEGNTVNYYWYKATKEDGFVVRFGSKNEYEKDESINIDLEEYTDSKGRKGYKESYED